MPLNLVRNVVRFTVAGIVSLPIQPTLQNPSALIYDVSIVKPHDAADGSMSWRFDQNGMNAQNVNLALIISNAWDLRPDQIVGEPSWVDELHWDITAKATDLTAEQSRKLTDEQIDGMMQEFLEERFHLKAHLETRTGSVFTLLPAKGGIKLKPILMTDEEKATGNVPDSGFQISGGRPSVMQAKKIPLSTLIANLAGNMHRTVIDKTGLPADALYDFTLTWAPDYAGNSATTTDAVPLPAALEEQLGIHVESSRGPVHVLVVDHVERPSSN